MISDVLVNAADQTNIYLKMPIYQQDAFDNQLLGEIKDIVAQMESLRRRLDVPPASE